MHARTIRRLVLVLLACAGSSASAQDGGVADAGRTVVIAAAGDISMPAIDTQKKTSDLLVDGGYDAILVLGDAQYPRGELANFNVYYGPTWGRLKAITWPSPGNHDYSTRGATGYYTYFGARAGDPARGYYSFNLGEWHIISLNSNCGDVSCSASSEQVAWLKADLAVNTQKCVLAFWHHPRFNSGDVHGNNTSVGPFWDALFAARADVVLAGHEHIYERFNPQTPQAVPSPSRGLQQFIVGTGGARPYPLDSPRQNSAVRNTGAFGVLKLTLKPGSYDWEFVPVSPATFTDKGSAVCH